MTKKEESRFAITASEAREKTDSSMAIINRIFKIIKEFASEGRHIMYYEVSDTELEIVKTVCSALESKGFTVEYKYDLTPDENQPIFENELAIIKISW